MINNYQEDKHSYKGKILEGIILGKVFIAIWICISVVLIVDLFNKKEHCVAEALIFMLYGSRGLTQLHNKLFLQFIYSTSSICSVG